MYQAAFGPWPSFGVFLFLMAVVLSPRYFEAYPQSPPEIQVVPLQVLEPKCPELPLVFPFWVRALHMVLVSLVPLSTTIEKKNYGYNSFLTHLLGNVRL